MGGNNGDVFKTKSQHCNWIILSLGGSLIVPPNGIDANFMSMFKKFIIRQTVLGKRFIIICGGGQTARDYQNAYKRTVSIASNDFLDWIGIHSTRLNAHFIISIFEDLADKNIVNNPNKKIVTKKPIVVAGGWKPGWSTDYVSIFFAKNAGAQRIINLTNTDGVYDTDPKGGNGKKAKMFKNISWNNYLAMIPKKWTPGLSSPFDPVASKKAQEMGLEVVIVDGNNLKNMELCLSSCNFKGTTINNLGCVPNLYPYVDGRKNRRVHRAEDLCIF